MGIAHAQVVNHDRDAPEHDDHPSRHGDGVGYEGFEGAKAHRRVFRCETVTSGK
jgi:hypothetical protein